MKKISKNYILREYKNDFFIINIENGDVYKIHELGFRALEHLSENYSTEEISNLLAGPNDNSQKVEKLMEPFWILMQNKGIVEDI